MVNDIYIYSSQNLLSPKCFQQDPYLSTYISGNDLELSLQTSKMLVTRDAEFNVFRFSFNIRNRVINCFAFDRDESILRCCILKSRFRRTRSESSPTYLSCIISAEQKNIRQLKLRCCVN